METGMDELGHAKAPTGDKDLPPAGSGNAMHFAHVFAAELRVIAPEITVLKEAAPSKNEIYESVDSSPTELSALCLSGGGIRSATFGLGVLQALARYRLLGQFHYLSTVSGGGYIGGWLSVWRKLQPDPMVFDEMNSLLESGKDPDQIRRIRFDSNYITPKLGLLSADTWTVLTLYLRNLLLNWLIFAPFFLGCLLYPLFWKDLLTLAQSGSTYTHYGALIVGSASLTFGLATAIYGRFHMEGNWLSKKRFLWMVLLPVIVSASSFCLAAQAVPDIGHQLHCPLVWGTGIGLGIYLLAWILGRIVFNPSTQKPDLWDLLAWVISGGVVGLLVALGIHKLPWLQWPRLGATFGLSGCVLAYMLGDIFHVGASSFCKRSDMDREWLARASGWLAAAAIIWAVVSGVALYGPDFLRVAYGLGVTLTAGGISGLVTLLLGSSEKTGATLAMQAVKKLSIDQIASIAAVILAIVLGALLAYAGQLLFLKFSDISATHVLKLFPRIPSNEYDPIDCLLTVAALCIAAILLAVFVSIFVNVNRFSLHALYRNRVARAFIGSARAAVRDPDPFTGFDHGDNLRLATVVPSPGNDSPRLFHVINASLNIVASKNLAWQERKAESFTFTRLHCGNPRVGYQDTDKYGGKKGGISLATATAISGAAVSPNEGYNSSPLVGFLLMLFNVRLGWWLGNPRFRWFGKAGPTLSLTPALKELAGATTDEGKWVYLSDGGHFENLGLYEMIRRRCRLIVVSDAGCDPQFTFEDLGNAARKVFIDFGVSIDFTRFNLMARANPPVPGARFAIGEITYPGSKTPGWLLYIKPTYQATERMDIRSYATQHGEFPHESTVNQWFSESQLESYRALGAHITESICAAGGPLPSPSIRPIPLTLDVFRKNVTRYFNA
jgi:hypothetical protein